MSFVRKAAKSAAGSVITALLGLGFFISCGLLGRHVWTAPALDYAIVGEFLLVAVLSLEGIVAVRHLRQSQLDSFHLLLEVLNDYRSAEMTLALVSLWRFRREHGDRFVRAYLEAWHRDEERIARLRPEDQEGAMRATLHYRRASGRATQRRLGGSLALPGRPLQANETHARSVGLLGWMRT